MRRKLLILDAFLLIAVVLLGWQWKARWDAARRRESLLNGVRVEAPAVTPLSVLPPVAPVKPTQYGVIAQQVLFHRDRNPVVVIEPPPPLPPPPPPPPMPELPRVFGFMNFSEPVVMMADSKGGAQRSYRRGDKVGEFKLLDVNNTDITLEWNGQPVKRRLIELVDRQPIQPVAAAPVAAAAAAPPASGVNDLSGAGKPQGPGGVSQGGQSKACQPGDTSPAGTVVDGLRKVLTESPFGKVCRWDPVSN